jgi:hypothetical protein
MITITNNDLTAGGTSGEDDGPTDIKIGYCGTAEMICVVVIAPGKDKHNDNWLYT